MTHEDGFDQEEQETSYGQSGYPPSSSSTQNDHATVSQLVMVDSLSLSLSLIPFSIKSRVIVDFCLRLGPHINPIHYAFKFPHRRLLHSLRKICRRHTGSFCNSKTNYRVHCISQRHPRRIIHSIGLPKTTIDRHRYPVKTNKTRTVHMFLFRLLYHDNVVVVVVVISLAHPFDQRD